MKKITTSSTGHRHWLLHASWEGKIPFFLKFHRKAQNMLRNFQSRFNFAIKDLPSIFGKNTNGKISIS